VPTNLLNLDAGRWFSAAFAKEPVPSLDQALQFCRSHGIWPNVEIKPAPGHEARTGAIVAQGVAHAYADALREHGDQAKSLDIRVPLLSSFAEDALVTARAAVRDLPRALLIDQLPDDWAARLERLGAVCVNTNHEFLTADAVEAVKQAGYWLFCYTVNDAGRARELMAWASTRSAPTGSSGSGRTSLTYFGGWVSANDGLAASFSDSRARFGYWPRQSIEPKRKSR